MKGLPPLPHHRPWPLGGLSAGPAPLIPRSGAYLAAVHAAIRTLPDGGAPLVVTVHDDVIPMQSNTRGAFRCDEADTEDAPVYRFVNAMLGTDGDPWVTNFDLLLPAGWSITFTEPSDPGPFGPIETVD